MVVLVNKSSNGGILATQYFTNSSHVGNTSRIHHIGKATAPFLYRTLRYKPLEDFEYVGLINEVPMTIIARGNFPADTFKDLLTYIKANKAKVTYHNAAIHPASPLCGQLLRRTTTTDFRTIPSQAPHPATHTTQPHQLPRLDD